MHTHCSAHTRARAHQASPLAPTAVCRARWCGACCWRWRCRRAGAAWAGRATGARTSTRPPPSWAASRTSPSCSACARSSPHPTAPTWTRPGRCVRRARARTQFAGACGVARVTAALVRTWCCHGLSVGAVTPLPRSCACALLTAHTWSSAALQTHTRTPATARSRSSTRPPWTCLRCTPTSRAPTSARSCHAARCRCWKWSCAAA